MAYEIKRNLITWIPWLRCNYCFTFLILCARSEFKTTFQVKLALQIWSYRKSSCYRTTKQRLIQTIFWPNKVFVSPLWNSCLKTVKKKIIFVCFQPITKLWEVTPSVGKFLISCLLWYKMQLCRRLRININESTAETGVWISRIA